MRSDTSSTCPISSLAVCLNNIASGPFSSVSGGGGGANQALSWFFIQLLPGNNRTMDSYQRFINDVVKTRIESVPGVAGVEIMAGAEEELQIVFDPYRAADLGIEIPRVAAIAGRADDASGGFVDVGSTGVTAGRCAWETSLR